MEKFRYLLSKWNHTWMVGDWGGGVFWGFSSLSDWCSGVSWLWGENMISIRIKWTHKGFKVSYLPKRKKEDQPGHLFGVLLLLKIGLEISFSYELSPWCKILCVFSQWPHLSELEHHSRYLVYRLARRSWSAAHSCWLLEDSDHHPVKSRSQRLQVKIFKKCCGRKFDLYLILA